MSDDARSVAFNSAAPAGERHDANAELHQEFRPSASDVVPAGDLAPMIAMAREQMEDEAIMAKSLQQAKQIMPSEHDAMGAGERGMRSVYLDDLQIFVSGDYYDKPAPLGFEGLRQMVEQTPVLSAVVSTRLRQVAQFAQISEDGGKGFEIRHIDRKHKVSVEEETEMKLLTRFIQNCGWEFNPRERKRLGRSSFSQFMLKSMRDSLTMDAAPIEVEMKRARSNGIDGFYAVDGSTIRLCTEAGYDNDDAVTALQVIQGRVRTAYTLDSLIYEVRNPRSDVRLAGYGLGEPELLIRCVTGILNAMSYTAASFDNNAIPKGILQLTGDYGKDDLASFRRYWNQSVKGINNSWALPVLVAKNPDSKTTFTKFGVEFSDMAFSKYITFMTSLVCAIYGMAPEEINFESFAAQKSTLSGSDTEDKITSSKDLGLHALLAFPEATITDYIVADFNPNYCFRWVGLQQEDKAQEWEAKKLILSVDELRAEKSYKPFHMPEIGGLILNPSLVGAQQAAMQAAQQAAQPQQGGDFGGAAPGAKPDFGDPGADEGDDDEKDGPPGGGGDEAGASAAPADAQGQPPPGGAGEASGPGQPGGFGGPGAGDFGKGLMIYSLEE